MSKPTVLIFTANSNTGYSVIEHIRAKFNDQVKIRAVLRSLEEKELIAEFEEAGIEVITGDIKKTKTLAPVFDGIHAAYFAVPTTKDRVQCVKNFVDMCLEYGVGYATVMSMCGSDDGKESTFYHKQYAEIERYVLDHAGLAVKIAKGDQGKRLFAPTIIRSPPFYQNFYGSLAGMQQGKLYYPLAESTLTHTDFNDVAKAVACVLVDPAKHAGKSYNIIGETQSGPRLAAAIAMKSGMPCEYEHVDDDIVVMAFTALGLQDWLAEGNVEMLRYIREGGLDEIPRGDFEAITGEKPAKFGDFVKLFLAPMMQSDLSVPWAHWTRHV